MKKIILMFLLLFPIITAKANTYYTDYGNWQEVTEIPAMEDDLFEMTSEKQYLWYCLKKEGMYLEEENSLYPIATDFIKYSDWSSWDTKKPEGAKSLEIQTRTVYHYQIRKPISWIRFSEISNDELEFENIQVYKNNKEISYQIHDIDQNLVLELSEPCHVDELDISITLIDFTDLEKHYKMEWLYELELPSAMELYTRHFFNGVLNVDYRYRNLVEHSTIWETEGSTFDKMESNRYCLRSSMPKE